jgi:chromosome partitioning protein
MTTICFINQKGGCGKSSSCFHLAGAFAQQGLRVLLVDADPQGSLSQGFLGSAVVEQLAPTETLAAVFRDDPGPLPRATACNGIALIPANQHLAAHNVPTPEACGLRQFAVQSLLERQRGFDLTLIDCPPNLYLCSWAALIAADFVVIPVPPEDFGTQGLGVVQQAIEQARWLNPRLELLGHLVTRSDSRLLVHRAYERKLRQLYGTAVLETVIPEAAAFKVALACRQPVADAQPRSFAARVTARLAEELLRRCSRSPAELATG